MIKIKMINHKLPTAIVTDTRYRMSLAIIRDLSDAGIKVIAVDHENLTPPLGFYSKKTDDAYFFNTENYLDDLYDLCKKELDETGMRPVIIPASTSTMNLLVEDEIKEKFKEVAGLCLAKKEHLELLNDKARAAELARKCGVNVPEYDGTFPCIVKPVFGEKYGIKAWNRYKLAQNKDELNAAVEHFKALCDGEEPLVQKYIDGDGYGFSVFAREGKIISSIAHRRVREYPVSGGPSTCCESVTEPNLESMVSSMVFELGLTGIAMFEFKKGQDGQFYLLEVNPRVWGSYPLTRVCRSSISMDWYRYSAIEGNMDKTITVPERKFVHRRMHFVLTDIRAGISYIMHGKVLLGLGALIDTLNPMVKGGLFEFKDASPAFRYVAGWLTRK